MRGLSSSDSDNWSMVSNQDWASGEGSGSSEDGEADERLKQNSFISSSLHFETKLQTVKNSLTALTKLTLHLVFTFMLLG